MLPAFVTGVATALVVGLGGVLVGQGTISTGAYIAVLALVPVFLRPVATWSGAVDTIQQARGWLTRLDDLLAQDEPPKGTAEPSGDGLLEFRDVSFSYTPSGPAVVDDLTLRVAPGRSVAFVGVSGSGKSTAARLAVGLLSPGDGMVLIDGVPIDECAPEFRAPASVTSNRTRGARRHDPRQHHAVRQLRRRRRFRAAARAAAIDAEIEDRPAATTLCRRRRAQPVGRATPTSRDRPLDGASTELVVLDEATSALDPVVEERVMASLLESGCGLLVIAHRLSTVRDCDEIIVMDHGRGRTWHPRHARGPRRRIAHWWTPHDSAAPLIGGTDRGPCGDRHRDFASFEPTGLGPVDVLLTCADAIGRGVGHERIGAAARMRPGSAEAAARGLGLAVRPVDLDHAPGWWVLAAQPLAAHGPTALGRTRPDPSRAGADRADGSSYVVSGVDAWIPTAGMGADHGLSGPQSGLRDAGRMAWPRAAGATSRRSGRPDWSLC